MFDSTAPLDLRLLRVALRLSQDELARRAGVSPSTISRVERGYRRPSPRVIQAIMAVLQSDAVASPYSALLGIGHDSGG